MAESTITLTQALSDACLRRGDAAFLLQDERSMSFRELDQAARRAAAGLARMGLRRGDRIGLLSLNRIEWVVLFFGAMRLGVAVVAMSPRYRDSELAYMVRDSEVKAVATIGTHEGFDFLSMFDRLAPELPTLRQLILFDAADPKLPAAPLRRIPYAELLRAEPAGADSAEPGDLAMVIYTSGTTGRPKGAGLTHASLLASGRAQVEHMHLDERDMLPQPAPLNHVGGITIGIVAFLCCGGRVDLIAEFNAVQVLERIHRLRPSILWGVPTMMTLLLMKSQGMDIDFSGVRIVFCGGSTVDDALLTQLEARIPSARLMTMYGLSETSGGIVITPWDASRQDLMTTIGKPIGNAEVRVTDLGSGAELPAGEVGELCFRGCGVVPGYVGAARDVSAFWPGGWLRTGDLGEVDARGVITFRGRSKDMYIQGGFNVYPAEVETYIARHPQVLLVAGIGVPDPVLGEIGRYYVIRKPGATVDEAELRAWCAEGLADYKVPRQFVFRDELPFTPAGKIHKASLRTEQAAR
ncbi:MAG: AMP-binding protein [Rhodanobacter sp.]|jgi:fatty-acyl-CoA synthase|nr:AMP-binding protein [Rhodanobacter sp.]